MYVCVCARTCVHVCVCVCKHCYHFVLLVVLMKVIFSHGPLKTLSVEQHLMYRAQVSKDIIKQVQGYGERFSLKEALLFVSCQRLSRE